MTLKRLEHGAFIDTADPGEQGYEGNPPRISVTGHEAQLLAALALGRTVLEIGTGLGVSTRAMSDTAYKVFTCDIDDWVLDTVVLSSNAQFIPRSTLVKLKDLPGSRMITMVFIDGLHTEAAVCADISLAREVVQNRGGIIVLHDIGLPPVEETIRQSGLKLIVEFDTHYGLGVYEP